MGLQDIRAGCFIPDTWTLQKGKIYNSEHSQELKKIQRAERASLQQLDTEKMKLRRELTMMNASLASDTAEGRARSASLGSRPCPRISSTPLRQSTYPLSTDLAVKDVSATILAARRLLDRREQARRAAVIRGIDKGAGEETTTTQLNAASPTLTPTLTPTLSPARRRHSFAGLSRGKPNGHIGAWVEASPVAKAGEDARCATSAMKSPRRLGVAANPWENPEFVDKLRGLVRAKRETGSEVSRPVSANHSKPQSNNHHRNGSHQSSTTSNHSTSSHNRPSSSTSTTVSSINQNDRTVPQRKNSKVSFSPDVEVAEYARTAGGVDRGCDGDTVEAAEGSPTICVPRRRHSVTGCAPVDRQQSLKLTRSWAGMRAMTNSMLEYRRQLKDTVAGLEVGQRDHTQADMMTPRSGEEQVPGHNVGEDVDETATLRAGSETELQANTNSNGYICDPSVHGNSYSICNSNCNRELHDQNYSNQNNTDIRPRSRSMSHTERRAYERKWGVQLLRRLKQSLADQPMGEQLVAEQERDHFKVPVQSDKGSASYV